MPDDNYLPWHYLKNALTITTYFLRKVRSTEQIRITVVFQSSAESTEAMRIQCLALRHNLLGQLVFEPSIAVSSNRHLTNMTNMLLILMKH